MIRAFLSAAVAMAMVVMLGPAPAVAQERGEWRERQEGERRFDPEQMRARLSERLKEQLGATDEEWEVLGPRIERVTTLQRQAGAGALAGMAGIFGRGPGGPGGRGGEGFARPGTEPSEVAQRTQELRTALADEDATPEQIRERLAALRAAREKAQADLEAARDELRELVTQRQEATLVMMGLLE